MAYTPFFNLLPESHLWLHWSHTFLPLWAGRCRL